MSTLFDIVEMYEERTVTRSSLSISEMQFLRSIQLIREAEASGESWRYTYLKECPCLEEAE
jgi:hypothetical protein